jgi:phosphonate transport system ATP-binding protein
MSPLIHHVVQARRLCVGVGGRKLLHNIDLNIGARESVAIVGHNGAGKSTLLRAISGSARVLSGDLCVHDASLSEPAGRALLASLRRRVSQVHQGLHLIGRLSALDNVLIGGAARYTSPLSWIRCWPRTEVDAARAALERVGMGWSSARRADSLSGGERQKVAVARALHQRAPLILADEPTASLDAGAAREIASLLSSTATESRATLITVVHDLNLVPLLAKRVLVLEHGAVIADWPVSDSTPNRLRDLLT